MKPEEQPTDAVHTVVSPIHAPSTAKDGAGAAAAADSKSTPRPGGSSGSSRLPMSASAKRLVRHWSKPDSLVRR